MKKLFLGTAALATALIAGLGIGLVWAHVHIRSIAPPLPAVAQAVAVDVSADLPVALEWINTASQRMPRSAVLDSAGDPTPQAPYALSHPAFVLEWSDGRLFLIDIGMNHEAALQFGGSFELVGADPIEPLISTANALDADVSRVAGLAFTHLHVDHTSGIAALCRRRRAAIRLFQSPEQASEANFTTRPGRRQLEAAPCLERHVLEPDALASIPGFPGLAVVAAGGHTPGSQLFIAHVRDRERIQSWAFAGDLVLLIDAVRLDLPKPRLYSLFIVPEAPARLTRLRALLRELAERGVGILVSHDQYALEASGIVAH